MAWSVSKKVGGSAEIQAGTSSCEDVTFSTSASNTGSWTCSASFKLCQSNSVIKLTVDVAKQHELLQNILADGPDGLSRNGRLMTIAY